MEACILADVGSVEVEDAALDTIDIGKALCLYVLSDCLWHAAYDHILPEVVHRLSVHYLTERSLCLEAVADKGHQHLISHSPQKLLEVYRMKLYLLLLRWDDDVSNVALDRHERARLDVVVPPIRYQVLDGGSGAGIKLYLVKDDERLPLVKGGLCVVAQVEEEHIQVIQILIKESLDLVRYPIEVNQDVTLVLPLGKFLHQVALADPSSPVNHQG